MSNFETYQHLVSVTDPDEMLEILNRGIKMNMANFIGVAFDDGSSAASGSKDKEGSQSKSTPRYRPMMVRVLGRSKSRQDGFRGVLMNANSKDFETMLDDFMFGVETLARVDFMEFIYFAIKNYDYGEDTFYRNCPGAGYMFGNIGDAKYPAAQIIKRLLQYQVDLSDAPWKVAQKIFMVPDLELYKLFIDAKFDPRKYETAPLVTVSKEDILRFNLSLGVDPNVRSGEGKTALAYILQHLSRSTEFISILLNAGAKVDAVDCESHNAIYYLDKARDTNPYASACSGLEVRALLLAH